MRIYITGPGAHLASALDSARGVQRICAAHGFEAVLPIDVAVDVRGLSRPAAAQVQHQEVLDVIRTCDGVVADMTPSRGCSMDAGVAFEIGYAAACGLPVVGWTEDDGEYLDRVLAFFRGNLSLDDGRWYDPHGREVEDFNQADSLMVCSALTALTCSFDQALLALKSQLHAPLAREA